MSFSCDAAGKTPQYIGNLRNRTKSFSTELDVLAARPKGIFSKLCCFVIGDLKKMWIAAIFKYNRNF